MAKIALTFALIVVTLLATLCSTAPSQDTDKQLVKYGSILDLSGKTYKAKIVGNQVVLEFQYTKEQKWKMVWQVTKSVVKNFFKEMFSFKSKGKKCKSNCPNVGIARKDIEVVILESSEEPQRVHFQVKINKAKFDAAINKDKKAFKALFKAAMKEVASKLEASDSKFKQFAGQVLSMIFK